MGSSKLPLCLIWLHIHQKYLTALHRLVKYFPVSLRLYTAHQPSCMRPFLIVTRCTAREQQVHCTVAGLVQKGCMCAAGMTSAHSGRCCKDCKIITCSFWLQQKLEHIFLDIVSVPLLSCQQMAAMALINTKDDMPLLYFQHPGLTNKKQSFKGRLFRDY